MDHPILLFVNALEPQANTVALGLYLAKNLKKPLQLYSVQHTPIPIYPQTGWYGAPIAPNLTDDRREEAARRAMANLCREIQQQWDQTDCEFDTGFFADSIVDKSRWLLQKIHKYQPTLLVMDKEHEYFWWNRIMPTSETFVAQRATCPVLVVPPEARFTGIQQITYLLDEEELLDRELSDLLWLASFSENFKAVLSCLYLPEEEKMPDKKLDAAMSRLQGLIPDQKIYYKQLDAAAEAEDILRFAADSPADLVAFPYEQRSFFQRLFGNDDSRRLMLKAGVPVLVM